MKRLRSSRLQASDTREYSVFIQRIYLLLPYEHREQQSKQEAVLAVYNCSNVFIHIICSTTT